jgi:acetyl esterase/lipase
MKGIAAALCLSLCCCTANGESVPSENAPVLSWNDVKSRPLPPSGLRLPYGEAPQQFGELRLPAGPGPFPVVVLIHGGCWLNAFDYRYFTHLAAALTALGYATWTPEYRRLGDPGGGWPGTFLDAASATDFLRELLRDHPLDLSRVVTMGHSAGGQLALWLAVRHKLPQDSELHTPFPLRPRGAIGLAPITDLHQYRIGPADSCNASVEPLLGGGPEAQSRRYAETSPLALLPLGVPQWLIQGGRDTIVPAAGVERYAKTAREKGDPVELLLRPLAGHFEPALPEGDSWLDLQAALQQALK